MHIAVLSDPNNFHTRKWARALEQAGARVTVFSLNNGTCGDIPTIQITEPGRQPGKFCYRSYLRTGAQLAEALRTHDVDLVNALNITPFGVWAAQASFKPCIYSALGADILEYPPKGIPAPHLEGRSWANIEGGKRSWKAWKDRLLRNYYRKKVGGALAYADLVTGDNQLLVDAMRDWFHVPDHKLKLLRWGVEPELFQVAPAFLQQVQQKFGITTEQKVVLSPRGAKAIYQADIILEGFAQLLEAGRIDTRFIMLSAGYEVSEKVAERAAALENQYPQFLFVPGIVPREEVYALWNCVDIMVSAPVYDGYSAALAEARYAGVIPLVNDIPGNREVIQHGKNGWVCTPFTPSQLANDLSQLLNQLPEWKAKVTGPNRRWIEQYSLVTPNAIQFLKWGEDLIRQNPTRTY